MDFVKKRLGEHGIFFSLSKCRYRCVYKCKTLETLNNYVIVKISFQDKNMYIMLLDILFRCREVHNKVEGFWETVSQKFQYSDFRRAYRMDMKTLQALVKFLNPQPRMYKGGHNLISPHKIIAMMCAYLGSQSTGRMLLIMFGVYKSALLDATEYIMALLMQKCKQVIKWPDTEEYAYRSNEFQKQGKWLPNCVCAIDGMHVCISVNKKEQIPYYNFKQFHSIHLQAVCTPDWKFIHIFVGWPGRAHDSRVYKGSGLPEILDDLLHVNGCCLEDSYHILGDSAFLMSNSLITPFHNRGGAMTDERRLFNHHLSSKRQVIKRAFGLLGQRFPRLLKLNVIKPMKRVMCVTAVCVLHSWCLMEDNMDETIFERVDIVTDVNIALASALARNRHGSVGTTKRVHLVDIVNEYTDGNVN